MGEHTKELSKTEREWLDENRTSHRERWVYSDNARSMIDDLVQRGIMQPAYGEFRLRPPPEPQEEISLLGKTIPIIGTMVSLYMMTPVGRAILESREGETRKHEN